MYTCSMYYYVDTACLRLLQTIYADSITVSTQTPLSRKEKGLANIKHFLGLADSAVLITSLSIRMLPRDVLHNSHATPTHIINIARHL